MANFQAKDASAATIDFAADGVGSVGDPHIPHKIVFQTTHDNLNLNANIQIGDVDVGAGNPVPVSDNGASLTVDNSTLAVVGGGAEATALRVTLANDSTGVLSVDDGGGALTVDNAGTFAVQEDGAALTALQLIDNIVHVDDAAFTPVTDSVAVIGGYFDDVTPDVVDEGDAGAVRMSGRRELYTQIRDAAGNERGVNVNASNQLEVAVSNTPTVTIGTFPDNEPFDLNQVGGTAVDVGSGALSAGTLRVVLATDQPVVSIDDNGAAITVDNAGTFTVQEDGAALTALQLIDDPVFVDDAAYTVATDKVMVLGAVQTSDVVDAGDAAALAIDTSRNLKVSIEADNVGIGGGTQYTEDDVAAANPTGNMPVMVRQDTPATLVTTDGDVVAQRATNYGAAYVQVLSSSGSFIDSFGGGTQYAVDTALGATPTGTLAIAIRDDALSALTPVEGDAVGLRVDANGALWVIPSGTTTVDNAGTFAVQEDGAALTALQLIDDPVFVDDAGFTVATDKVMVLGAVQTSDVVDAGDAAALAIDTSRNLKVSIEVDNVGIGGGTQYTEDDVAAANPTGNMPVLVRQDTPATLVSTDGDVVAQRATNYGAAYVQILSSSGSFIDSFGGGTQYAVDDALGATPTGTLAVAIRDDALSALTPVEGDAIGLRVDANGALWVIPSGTTTVDNAGTFAVQEDGAALTALQLIDDIVYTDDTDTHSTGVSKGALMMAAATPTDGSVTANDIGSVAMSLDRRLHTDAQIVGQDAALDVSGATVTTTPAVVGGGTEAAAQRVTIANDSTGVLTVDNAGTFVVQEDGAALTALQLIDDPVFVDDAGFTVATDKVMVMGGVQTSDVIDAGDAAALALDTSRNLKVSIEVDNVGIGGGTQYTEDVAAAGDPVGTAQILVRQDTPATLVTTDGDNVARRGTNYGAAYSQIVTSSGSFVDSFGGGTEYTEDDALPANPVGGALIARRRDTLAAEVTTQGDAITLNATNNGELYVKHEDSIPVTNAGTFVVQEDGAALTALQLIDDVVYTDDTDTHATGSSKGALMMAAATPTDSAVDANDIGALAMSTDRRLLVDSQIVGQDAALDVSGATVTTTPAVVGGGTEATAQRVTIANDSTGVLSVDYAGSVPTISNAGMQVTGDEAHDAADAGNPVKVGHKAIAHGTNPTAVAANDRSDWYANRHGVPWVIGGHPNIVTIRANYTAAQTDAAIVTVAGGLKIVVTRCSVTADNANSVDVQARVGFGATTTPTTTGVVLSHPGIAPGSGVVEGDGSGMLGVGADGEDLRITSEVPTGGSIDVVVSYYTIES